MSQSAFRHDDQADRSRTGTRAPSTPRTYPILVYLAFLIAVVILPALAFTGVLIQRHNVAQESVVETFTVATTRSVVQAVEREISGMITTLGVLMNVVGTLENDDLEQFHNNAQTALAGTGAHLIVADENYNQLLNTRVPFGTELTPMSNPRSAQEALETTDAVVSDLFFGRTADDYVFNVVRARRPDGNGPPEFVILTQNASSLANAVLTRELPEGWHVALVDGNNTVIAASQDSAVVGEELFIPLSRGAGTSMGWRDAAIGEETYKTITQRSILTGWYVVSWAPVSVVTSPLRTSLLWLLLGALVIVGLAGVASALVGRQIATSVRGLARQARALGSGQTIQPRVYPVQELTEVSTVLSQAGAKRKAAETEARLLMRELAHRSKNQLTVISSMAKQTAAGTDSVEQFVESFQNRIYGLARSTDLLLANGSHGIALRDLFKTHIDPFRPEDPERVKKTGPEVRLNMQAAQVLGMAAHEMATNAAKYGAFSRDGGTLRVDWRYTSDGRLELVWCETVPDFTPPDGRRGFGTVVIETMVKGSLGAEVERKVNGNGIAWEFSIPLERIDPETNPPGAEEFEDDDEETDSRR